jgi:hypothetical protein
MGSDDQQRYTLSSAEATEFKQRADREMSVRGLRHVVLIEGGTVS